MKGVKHYKKDGTLHKGAMHKMKDGTAHTGSSHTAKSVKLFHLKDLSKAATKKLENGSKKTKSKK
tara:strand:- start:56 stop:250 length:195 start_codon:yes stop_codon:yes gene_type:complete